MTWCEGSQTLTDLHFVLLRGRRSDPVQWWGGRNRAAFVSLTGRDAHPVPGRYPRAPRDPGPPKDLVALLAGQPGTSAGAVRAKGSGTTTESERAKSRRQAETHSLSTRLAK
ncbi:hypothetical protein Sros01_73900 [Streptomyces roseochromogenus]|nr:hypothetical protein Sros01_73900 [Streptomyces roseochromogenus]